jgi:hypothetical protein
VAVEILEKHRRNCHDARWIARVTDEDPDHHSPATTEGGPSSDAYAYPESYLGLGVAGRGLTLLLAIFLVAEVAVAFYVLIDAFPAALALAQGSPRASTATLSIFGSRWSPSPEGLYLCLVAAAGALGGATPTSRSFVWYVGNGALRRSWIPFYLFRLPTSIALAVVVYFGVRAGLVNVNANGADLNPYGVVAIAAFTGFFSEYIAEYFRRWAYAKFGETLVGKDHVGRGDHTPPGRY